MNEVTQRNMDAVRRFLAAVNRDDRMGMFAELDEQVTWRTPVIHGVVSAREFSGHAAVAEVLAEARVTARGDLRVVLHTIDGDEETVLAEGALSSPGGTTPIAYVMQMRDGKILYADTFTIPGEARASWDRRVK